VIDVGKEHEQSWFLDQLIGGRTIRCLARAVFPKRGIYRAGPLVARCRHPFGLVQQRRKLCDEEQWVILPALGQLNFERFRQWITRMARSDGQLIRTTRPSMTRQDDLHGLRPFRPGDSPRWIHWRTSARRNQKMVREFEEASGQNLMVIVDPWGPESERAELDRAISLAATICWDWARHGNDQLFFASATSEPVVIAGSATKEKSLLMLAHAGSFDRRRIARCRENAPRGFAEDCARCSGHRRERSAEFAVGGPAFGGVESSRDRLASQRCGIILH